MKKYIAICCFSLMYSISYAQDLFDEDIVHEIRIQFKENNYWGILNQYYQELQQTGESKYLKAAITIDGNVIDSVGIRQRGKYSHTGFPGKKKPLKIDFNEFVKGNKYQGYKKLNLANFAADPSLMRDLLSYKIHELSGNLSLETAYAKVYLNDEFWGLYLMVEQVDKTYLKKHFSSHKGNLYKSLKLTDLNWVNNQWSSYKETIELKTNEKTPNHDAFIHFLDVINHQPSKVEEVFDIEGFIGMLAVDAMINNWDSYYDNGRNFYIYHNPDDNKFHWIPWDYNLAFWNKDPKNLIPIDENKKKALTQIIQNNTHYKSLYYTKVCQLLDSVFTQKTLEPIILKNEKLVQNILPNDSNLFYPVKSFSENLRNGVKVIMPRGGVNTEVFLPGLLNFIQIKKNKLTKLLIENDWDCNNTKIKMSLQPNPSNSFIQVYNNNTNITPQINQLMIYNTLGQKVYLHPKQYQEKEKITISQLPVGLYYIYLTTKDKQTAKLKFLKR